jgi:hypothetical protein
MVICVCVGFSSDHFNEKPFHVVGCAILSAISFIVIIPLKNFTARYVLLVFGGAGIWVSQSILLARQGGQSLMPLSPSVRHSSLPVLRPLQLQEP